MGFPDTHLRKQHSLRAAPRLLSRRLKVGPGAPVEKLGQASAFL